MLSGAGLLGVSSVLVHPFGAIKAQRSDKPLLLDSTFDPQVMRTLEKSCQNCHSEKTEWPWYSYVAPMSWMIENDVQLGRSHMNLSHWNGYNADQQQEILRILQGDPNACVVWNPRIESFWNPLEFNATSPLASYIVNDMPRVSTIGDYQIRVNPQRRRPWIAGTP